MKLSKHSIHLNSKCLAGNLHTHGISPLTIDLYSKTRWVQKPLRFSVAILYPLFDSRLSPDLIAIFQIN